MHSVIIPLRFPLPIAKADTIPVFSKAHRFTEVLAAEPDAGATIGGAHQIPKAQETAEDEDEGTTQRFEGTEHVCFRTVDRIVGQGVFDVKVSPIRRCR